ncbi:MAG: Lrp/AsnC family transcriptional regulator [Pseudomonadota bacterium]|nr:Lrp/AsnC family transcriptional regulator [Pseudomonadota bacterium]
MRPDTPADLLRLPAGIDLEDARLIDRLQHSLPITERPFADIGAELRMSEPQVIDRLHRLLKTGVLTRFGPLFHIERAGGQFILAALQVPEERYADVTAQINALPEIAHNYRREHTLNMWFVVAAETPEAAWATCDRIEAATGLPVHAFPKEREYFVGLYLPLLSAAPRVGEAPARAMPANTPASRPTTLSEFDRQLVTATQSGLPLVQRPYDTVAAMLGSTGEAVRARLSELLAAGVVRRIAAVPNHYRLGYAANGMSVWDVDDAEVDRLGELIGSQPAVSHSYRRPRKPGVWRYNLFAMLHGHTRDDVLAQAEVLAQLLGPARRAHDVLFSSAILKKTGLRLRQRIN